MAIKGVDPIGVFRRGGHGLAAFFALMVLAVSCTNHGLGGTRICGTEVQDPWEVAGCVEDENGDPALAVRVVAYPTSSSAQSKISSERMPGAEVHAETVLTDKHGVYLFNSLPEGEYNLFYEDSANRDSRDWKVWSKISVKTQIGGSQILPPYQLRKAATLIASIYDERSNEPIDNAECKVLETPYRAVSDSGVLNLYLPDGAYQITCERLPFTSTTFTVVVVSGQDKVVRVPMNYGERDPKIPPPTNVVAVLDSATGIVRISWSKPLITESLQFRIRRVETETPAVLKLWLVGADTTYFDAVFGGEPETVTSKVVFYKVDSKRVDNRYSPGADSKLMTVVRGPTIQMGFLDTARTTCTVGDTVLLLGSYKSRFHNNAKLLWTTRNAVDTLKTRDLDDRSGVDTLRYECATPGDAPLEFRVKDETGVTAVGRAPFKIIPAP